MVQVEDPKGQPMDPGSPPDSDGGLSGYCDTKLTISSATVEEDIAMLAKMVRDAARLDESAEGLGPTAHTIELCFTAHETSSLDVYDSFGDWLEDLSKIVKDKVAAARPRQAVSTPKSPAQPYTRKTTRNTASGGWEASRHNTSSVQAPVDRPARQPIPQVPRPQPPTDTNRLKRWKNFFDPPPAEKDHTSPARPSTHSYVTDICSRYEDSD